MLIKLIRQDIDQGIRGHVRCCPVANAIRRHVKADFIKVDSKWVLIQLEGSNELREIPFSKNVRDRIIYYDHEGEMEPFSFRLTLTTNPGGQRSSPGS